MIKDTVEDNILGLHHSSVQLMQWFCYDVFFMVKALLLFLFSNKFQMNKLINFMKKATARATLIKLLMPHPPKIKYSATARLV